jgi:hypothetical protein
MQGGDMARAVAAVHAAPWGYTIPAPALRRREKVEADVRDGVVVATGLLAILPAELLRRVVGYVRDARQLERLGATCKVLWALSREEAPWSAVLAARLDVDEPSTPDLEIGHPRERVQAEESVHYFAGIGTLHYWAAVGIWTPRERYALYEALKSNVRDGHLQMVEWLLDEWKVSPQALQGRPSPIFPARVSQAAEWTLGDEALGKDVCSWVDSRVRASQQPVTYGIKREYDGFIAMHVLNRWDGGSSAELVEIIGRAMELFKEDSHTGLSTSSDQYDSRRPQATPGFAAVAFATVAGWGAPACRSAQGQRAHPADARSLHNLLEIEGLMASEAQNFHAARAPSGAARLRSSGA